MKQKYFQQILIRQENQVSKKQSFSLIKRRENKCSFILECSPQIAVSEKQGSLKIGCKKDLKRCREGSLDIRPKINESSNRRNTVAWPAVANSVVELYY